MTWRSVSSGSEFSVGSSSRRSKTLAAVHTAARSLAARNGVASAASSCRQVCAFGLHRFHLGDEILQSGSQDGLA